MPFTPVRRHSRIVKGRRMTKVKRHLRKVKKKEFKRGKPKLPFKKIKAWKTTFIQDPKTGLMKGRKYVPGPGDRTGIQMDLVSGRIFGRIPKLQTKKKILK